MKLEFLSEGSHDCPLIRLYDFDATGAARLREAFRSLADGSSRAIDLHEEWWIEPLEGCRLTLRVGARDLGVVQRLPMAFDCVLGKEGWLEMADKSGPFCQGPLREEECQWLNQDGEISLLLSPRGTW